MTKILVKRDRCKLISPTDSSHRVGESQMQHKKKTAARAQRADLLQITLSKNISKHSPSQWELDMKVAGAQYSQDKETEEGGQEARITLRWRRSKERYLRLTGATVNTQTVTQTCFSLLEAAKETNAIVTSSSNWAAWSHLKKRAPELTGSTGFYRVNRMGAARVFVATQSLKEKGGGIKYKIPRIPKWITSSYIFV